MDEIYCSKCGKELKYTWEHFRTNNKYIVEPCNNCMKTLVDYKDDQILELFGKLDEKEDEIERLEIKIEGI
jgi:NAD-dependent SIR2 family protein deacetylase